MHSVRRGPIPHGGVHRGLPPWCWWPAGDALHHDLLADLLQSAGVQFPMEEARQGRTLYAAHPDFPTGRRIRVLAGMYRHARSRATGLHGTGAWPYEPVVLANGSCTNPRLG